MAASVAMSARYVSSLKSAWPGVSTSESMRPWYGNWSTLDWIENAQEPVHSEFRDDRFTAAFERKAKDAPVFTVAYVVRAVSPGRYVVPQAYVEDMYRPDRFGRTGTSEMEVTAAR